MPTKKYYPSVLISLLIIILALAGWSVLPYPMPVRAATSGTLQNITEVAAGVLHTCALTTIGGVKCWGYNGDGQLGNGTYVDNYAPVDASELSSDATALSVGEWYTCVLTTTGGVKCWGSNNAGQLGDGTTVRKLTPVDVIGLNSGVTAISAGSEHTCVLITTGGVKCWGDNDIGQLGDGTNVDKYIPVDVIGLSSGVTAISAGLLYTCALTPTGGVKCWGYNVTGQLGDGTNVNKYTPVDVNGLSSDVAAISAGVSHTCALTITGGVKCWGYNGAGELGDDTTIGKLTPVDVNELSSGVAAISAGWRHTCALTTIGGVKCWGYNGAGELGDGTNVNKYTPVDVSGLSSGVAAISAGYAYTCALTTTGGVKCWGSNYKGRLGDGTTVDSNMPVDVVDGIIPTATPSSTATTTQTPTPTNTPIPTDTPTATPTPVNSCLIGLNNGSFFTNQSTVTVQANAPDAVQMQLSNDGSFTAVDWQAYQATVNWALPDIGSHIATLVVYARFRDAKNNLLCAGFVATDSIIYDVQAPSVSVTASQLGTLHILAEDQPGGSGVTDMQISTQSNFADTSWQRWQADIAVDSEPGATHYVRVRDGAGNESAPVSTQLSPQTMLYLPFVVR